MNYRIEKDTGGEVRVPSHRYWGAQTQRSLENFRIGAPGSMPREVIYAYGYLKKAAAIVNNRFGLLSEEKRNIISEVCNEITEGSLDDHFPLVIWQTGSGTHTNMNVNEVIAHRAGILLAKKGEALFVHPNDDVNMSQSSNDTFPSAMNIAAFKKLSDATMPAIKYLEEGIRKRSNEWKNIIKTGRTHMMDAVPLTLGQEFSGYAAQLEHGIRALSNTLSHLSELAAGGTAVGTGLNTPEGYDQELALTVASLTGLPFKAAANKFEAMASHDSLVEAHGALKQLAVSLMKIAGDIRLLASGPRTAIGEILLPFNEPGSSIMPGKSNPTQAEALAMVCARVMGNDTTISVAGAGGQLELNVYKPLIISAFLESASLLADACRSFTDNCMSGITPDTAIIEMHLGNSLMIVTALNKHIGYEKGALIVKKAAGEGITLREAAVSTGLLTGEEYDRIVVLSDMTGPFKQL
ncbi:MAG: class II fumarate hydratase [Bacteroidales bacterium]|nr:class II fumarate hydratase [Bacteroidales bacterium]